MDDDMYWVWISRMEGLTFECFDILMKKYGSPRNLWNISKKELLAEPFCSVNLINNIFCKHYRQNLEKHIWYIQKHNIKIINCYSKDYPIRLKFICNRPIVLYTMGDITNINNESVAIVGSRMCTKYGEQNAKYFSFELSKRKVNVVSGLAKGIDAIAHSSCIEAEGKTIAVVGHRFRYDISI